MDDINRIKLVLVEKKRTSKWLSEQMGVTPSTVSKWLLDVDIKELIVREYKSYLLSKK